MSILILLIVLVVVSHVLRWRSSPTRADVAAWDAWEARDCEGAGDE